MRHAVIMAGGAGTRLWPLSRKLRPKQLLRLFDGKSLLQLARERLRGLFEPANIWVITSQHYLDQVAAALPDIPRANLIGEPMGRDTANAIGLAANLLARRDPDATMAVFTADHIITPQERFAEAITIFLRPSSRQELERRLRGRGTETEQSIRRRLAQADGELALAGRYRYQVINDDMDQAVQNICGILTTEWEKSRHD